MNFNKYVGIPWLMGGRDVEDGLDCWGFVRYFYDEEMGIVLPRYDGTSKFDNGTKGCSKYIIESDTYKHFVKFDEYQPGDICMFTFGGFPIHVGIAVDERLMLHANEHNSPPGVAIDNYKALRWKNRLEGFYRHESLLDKGGDNAQLF